MSGKPTESKRVRRLRDGIIKVVPRFPNDKASKEKLEQMSVANLLIVFLSWQMRFVRQGKRTIAIRQSASKDPQWKLLKPQITQFLKKVESGDDLSPHLSLGAWREGYTPATQRIGAAVDRWADKDFLLNVMGFHHFHLGTKLEKKGFVERTDKVLFAFITRTTFDVLGIFDHSVFENQDPTAMPAERTRLWQLYNEFLAKQAPPGSYIIANMISLSGHQTGIVMLAQRYARWIKELDPKLVDREFLAKNFYTDGLPKKPKLEWAFQNLDLLLADETNKAYFLIQRAPY
ncbi:MAG: hypothetical protein KJ587_16130 [Alphaproteobacteria bacterium]|nr:hypothetical protein [Alphaproteobacteria bacterium]